MAELKDLIVNGQSTLIGDTYYKTHDIGTSDDRLASTKFVVTAVNSAIATAIANLSAGAMHFIGVTTATMVDEQTTNPSVTGVSSFSAGDVVIDATEAEFVLGKESTPKWHKFGHAASGSIGSTSTADDAWKTVVHDASLSSLHVLSGNTKTIPAATTSVDGYMSKGQVISLNDVVTKVANTVTEVNVNGQSVVESNIASFNVVTNVATTGTGSFITGISTPVNGVITASLGNVPSVSISTSGSGAVVTNITASNHTVTMHKGDITHPSVTISTSGSGNVITDISASGHAITATKGSITVPTATDQLTNNSGFITTNDLTDHAKLADTTESNKMLVSNGSGYLWDNVLVLNATTDTSGTAANTVSGSRKAAIWRVSLPLVTSLYTGLTILFKVPVAGNGSYGTMLRIDGTDSATDSDTNLYPVCANANSMVSTRYAVNCIIALTFDAELVGAVIYDANTKYTTASDGTGWEKPGCWKIADYDANTNTIGYLLRLNNSKFNTTSNMYRYRLCFTSLDGQSLVPINNSTATNTTTARSVNANDTFDPFGLIYYYGTTTAITKRTTLIEASSLWTQYLVDTRYSYMASGYSLVTDYPVYIKAEPQSGGGAKLIANSNPFIQALPTEEDGYIYIYLGKAYGDDATTYSVEIADNKSVYYYKDGAIRVWTNPAPVAVPALTINTSTALSGITPETSGFVTGIGNSTTDNFVKSYTPSTKAFVTGYSNPGTINAVTSVSVTGALTSVTPTSKKLTTTTITAVGGTVEVSKATAGTAATVLTSINPSTTTIYGVATNTVTASKAASATSLTATVISTVTPVTALTSASYDESTYTLTLGSSAFNTVTTQTLTVPQYTFSDVTVPVKSTSSNTIVTGFGTNGSMTITPYTFSTVTAATPASAGTVLATGGLSATSVTQNVGSTIVESISDSGTIGNLSVSVGTKAVLTSIGTVSTAAAVTALGNPTTGAAITALGTLSTAAAVTALTPATMTVVTSVTAS